MILLQCPPLANTILCTYTLLHPSTMECVLHAKDLYIYMMFHWLTPEWTAQQEPSRKRQCKYLSTLLSSQGIEAQYSLYSLASALGI